MLEKVTHKERFLDTNGNYLEISEWPNTVIDKSGKIIEFMWYYGCIISEGTIDISWMPRQIVKFSLSVNKFYGTIDTAQLPRGCEYMGAHSNHLIGPFVLEHLPPRVEYVDISTNNFSGALNIAALPKAIKGLYAYTNEFNGTLDLRTIPVNTEMPDLHCNHFEQTELYVGPMPDCLEVIDIRGLECEKILGVDGYDLDMDRIEME